MLKCDAISLFIYERNERTYLGNLMSALNVIKFSFEILILLHD
jgi:hypothetical protein